MQLTILGNNSALPNHNRYPTAQVLAVGNELILIDCGEGTQMRLQSNQIRSNKISKIFISHLHGDHYFGLIGLLTRYSLNHRTEPIDLFGPAQLINIIQFQLDASATRLSYELHFHPVSVPAGDQVIWQQDNLVVTAFPTQHRIECYGYKFEEIRDERKLLLDIIEQLQIPKELFKSIKEGKDITHPVTGSTIPNSQVAQFKMQRSTYVFAADTRYTESFLDIAQDCDLLYHETTYLKDHAQLAFERFHSTTEDAARLALRANAKQLLIGHFSSKYSTLNEFQKECSEIFPNTLLSFEGMRIEI